MTSVTTTVYSCGLGVLLGNLLLGACSVSTRLEERAFEPIDAAPTALGGASDSFDNAHAGAALDGKSGMSSTGGLGGSDSEPDTCDDAECCMTPPCGPRAGQGGSAESSDAGGTEAAPDGTRDAAEPPKHDSGLLLHYSFDEGGGTLARDEVRDDQSGTLRGGAGWTTGKLGGALLLEGSPADALDPQYVELPANLLSGLAETSIIAWVRWDGGEHWQRVFDFGADPAHGFYVTPQAPDAPGAPDAGAAQDIGLVVVRPLEPMAPQVHLQVRPLLHVAEWTHVAVTWTRDALIVYVDGQKAASTPAGPYAPNPEMGPSSLGELPEAYIGRSLSPADPYFGGAIDDFRVYDRALTQAEVIELRDLSP